MVLLIDCSQEKGFVALADKEEIVSAAENDRPREHASWLHPAIGKVLADAGTTIRDLKAVAVVAGPGSYTGLRVGMSAAKGLCYALKIPMITQGSLRIMAESMLETALSEKAMICPMIDARRDEVFTALYLPQTQTDLSEIFPPRAMILDKNAFEEELSQSPVIFFGTGSGKWKNIISHSNAIFKPEPDLKASFAKLSYRNFLAGHWADPIYAEPVYGKEFFSY